MNSVIHFEIPTDDQARARGFYTAAFGWATQDFQPDYTVALTTEADPKTWRPLKPGAVNGALMTRKHKEQKPLLVLHTSDMEADRAKIKAAGGDPFSEVLDVGMGLYSQFKDTEGNILALFQPKM